MFARAIAFAAVGVLWVAGVGPRASLRGGPIHDAAARGALAEAKALLAAKPQLADAPDKWGVRPLFWAAAGGHKDLAALLIAKGGRVGATDWCDRTPLHWAAGQGHHETVQLLLANGAPVGARDRYG